uniref:Uncharacterized protein n=1 Tax=Glossina austeni TaxID=7395 RepID=A0A1A9V269_GLOAU
MSFEPSRLGKASGEAVISALPKTILDSSEEFSPDGLLLDLRFLGSHTNSSPHESSSEESSHDLRFLEFSFGSNLTSSGLSSTLTMTVVSSDESSSEDLSHDLRFLKFSFGSNLTSSGLSSTLTTAFVSSDEFSSEDLSAFRTNNLSLTAAGWLFISIELKPHTPRLRFVSPDT